MKLLLALTALLFSSSIFANSIAGHYEGDKCLLEGKQYYKVHMDITEGEFEHIGSLVESYALFSDSRCTKRLKGGNVYRFEYTKYPTDKDGIFEFNVYKEGERKISFFDIIGKGEYQNRTYIFFGKGGPVTTEDKRPTELDVNRRFGVVRK